MKIYVVSFLSFFIQNTYIFVGIKVECPLFLERMIYNISESNIPHCSSDFLLQALRNL